MIILSVRQVAISSSQKKVILNSVKIHRNDCFLTETWISSYFWKIFPEYDLNVKINFLEYALNLEGFFPLL